MHCLYYSPGACSLAVHIVLEEIGQPYALELVSSSGPLEGSGTSHPAWKAKNPKGRIPALSGVRGSIGGAENLLTEVNAILFYLGGSYRDAGLLPREIDGQARAIEWMNWLSGSVHGMSYGQIWRPNRYIDEPGSHPALREKGRSNLREQYGLIERLLSDGRRWALGEAYSIVDPYLFVFFIWGQRIGLTMTADFPGWARMTKEMLARSAVRRVTAKEGLAVSI